MDEKHVYLNHFTPKDYQKAFVKAFEKKEKNRFILIWPRRSGKDICALNMMILAALERVGTYFYVFPTFSQGRRSFWSTIDNEGRKVLDYYLPPEIVYKKNEQLMRITLINGSQIQVVGSDNIDNAIVGANAVGMIFSEYALQHKRAWELSLPIIRGTGGWAVFASTVRGKNFFWDLYNNFKDDPNWFVDYKTIEDTKHIPIELIEEDIEKGAISRPMALQEYWNRWETGSSGAYFSDQMNDLRLAGRFTQVPYDPYGDTFTSWDLGWNDSTTIVFYQIKNNVINVFDYYENNRQPLDHYARVIKDKGYNYKNHFAPHDIAVHELGSGIGRWQTMYDLGVVFFRPDSSKHKIIRSRDEGIEEVRKILPRCYFDEEKCAKLIKHLENYQEAYDEKTGLYKGEPMRNSSTHAADAFRMMAVNLQFTEKESTAEDIRRRYNEVYLGNTGATFFDKNFNNKIKPMF